ncbi:MAG: AI-2E family transporter [Planctomycetota bacterium]|nr:AI-2E family transporter [Planctomycetota bacterium]
MLERLSPTKRNLALGLLAVLLLWFSWTVRAVLNPLILGYLLAFVLSPMVRKLERKGWGRRSAANLIFLAFFVLTSLIGLVVFWQGRALARDVSESDFLKDTWTQVEQLADSWLQGEVTLDADGDAAEAAGSGEGAQPPGPEPGPVDEVTTAARAGEAGAADPADEEAALIARVLHQLTREQNQARALEGATLAWRYLRSFFGSLIALATLMMLLPIYAYFLLFELDRIHAFVYRYIPRAEKERCARIGRQVGEVLANFFRGRLLICVLKGAVITVGLLIVQVPYAVFLGMGSGFLSLVPFVGPTFGFVAAFALAAFPPGAQVVAEAAPGTAAWVPLLLAFVRTAAVFVIAELLEGYVFLPKVLGDSLGLHPVVVLASIFLGGAALGIFGFLIALPLTAALVILGRELVLPALADFADEEPQGPGEDAAAGEPG